MSAQQPQLYQQPQLVYKQQEQATDPILKWGGMMSNLPLQSIPRNNFSYLLNMHFPGPNIVQSRPGTTYFAQSLVAAQIVAHYEFMKTADNDATEVIVCADRNIYSFNTTNPARTLTNIGQTTNLTPQAGQVWMAQLADKLYIADGVSALKWTGAGNVTDIKSTFPATTPATGNIVCCIKALSRIWWSDSNNFIYGSEINDPDTLSGGPTNYMEQVSYNDGTTISGIAPWGNTIVIFKSNNVTQKYQCYKMTGDGSSSNPFTVVPLYGDDVVPTAFVGKSALQINGDLYGLTRDGVTTISAIQNFQTTQANPLSIPIGDIIQRINWLYASGVQAYYDPDTQQYLLAVPLDGSSFNNYILVLDLKVDPDTQTQAYRWSLWNNWSVSCWARMKGKNYYCDLKGSVIQTGYGDNDLGGGYQKIAESGNDNMGYPDVLKMFKSMEFYLYNSGQYPITFYYIVDDFAGNNYNSVQLTMSNDSSLWDQFIWDQSFWDMTGRTIRTALILARGKTIRFRFYNDQPNQPFAISTLTKRWVQKGVGTNQN